MNGQNGPDVKATIVRYSRVKPSDIKVIGMEDIHKAKYSTYFAMDQVRFHKGASNSISDWFVAIYGPSLANGDAILKPLIRHG